MMDKLNAQQKDAVKAGIILAVILFAGAYAYYAYLVQPEVKSSKDKTAKLRAEIQDLDGRLAEMDSAEANLEALREKQALLEQVAAKLPSTVAPEETFRALEEIFKVTRVDYTQLTPQPLAERETYSEIPYRLTGRGRYHDFGQFLNMVEENNKRLMRIKNFTVENDDERPSIHPLTVELATFKFKSKVR